MGDHKIKIIEENEKSYTAIADGKKVVLWKVDTKALEAKWKVKVGHASKNRSLIEVKQMIDDLEMLIDNPPTIVNYEETVLDICKEVDKYINSTPPGYNVYHTIYKYLHPECYGKAQTFIKYSKRFLEILKEMEKFKESKKCQSRQEKNRMKLR